MALYASYHQMGFFETIGEIMFSPVLDVTEWWLARIHRKAWDRHTGKLLPLQRACASVLQNWQVVWCCATFVRTRRIFRERERSVTHI